MESSSIVSFNNDSTYQTTIKAEYNNVSVHELALHAMRDRCLLLQRRINKLETDNMRLKHDVTKSSEKSPYVPLTEDEKLILQQKIADLSRQKSQLLHHVFMVSCENKNLWSKLSSLKGADKNSKETNKPLVRTNTYIHSTPKQNTKENIQEKYSDSSLEEISLKVINSYILEKSQLIEQYEQMTQLQDADDDVLNVDSIGFVYMEDPATDSLKEIRNQTEKLLGLKKELDDQEKSLKLILSRIENGTFKCATCIKNPQKLVSCEDKETETSDSLMWAMQEELHQFNNQNSLEEMKENSESQDVQTGTESCDKICPICGDFFQKGTAFTVFQSHVENHFVGETDVDSLDNFENTPNSLDN